MRSVGEAREILTRLYGIEFPDSLFLLHEFLAGPGAEEWQACSNALGMSRIGPLQVLSLPEAELHRIKTTTPLVLHWRYYHDVPEFFSCLFGDQDLLHWGLLLDEPKVSGGPRPTMAMTSNQCASTPASLPPFWIG